MLGIVVGIGGGVALLVVGGVLALLFGGFIAIFRRTEYIVRIASASGETDAFKSGNKSQIEAIIDAISKAIVERG